MDAYRIHDMLENVSEAASTELAKGTDKVNTKEFGEVVDMIKDLTEAEKNKMEACYYKTLVEAMEKHEYVEDYDEYGPVDNDRMGYPRNRDSRGRFVSNRSRRSYSHDDMWDDPRFLEYVGNKMGYSNGAYGGGSRNMTTNKGSRYGYSYDNYMNRRSNYSMNDPEDKQERIKMLDEYTQDLVGSISDVMKDVSPEEKNMLRNKLTKLVNTMQ